MQMNIRLTITGIIILVTTAFTSLNAVIHAQNSQPKLRWYKGNTHTHTVNSDGDSTPDEVVRWYREHGYQFLVLTDHNFLTSVEGLNALHGADEQFLVIRFKRPWDRGAARPGQGWVMVRAASLAAREILAALERGDFYATTGVELAEYQADEKSITIKIKEAQKAKHRVQFIGENGRLLKETATNPADYQIRGDERYVRAKVTDSNGRVAWTQPIFVM